MSVNVAATMAGGIAAVLLIIYIFRWPVAHGLFLSTLPFSGSQIKKSSRVETVDQGSRSSLVIILSPKKLFISSKAQLNV
jgi:hypothetical protein